MKFESSIRFVSALKLKYPSIARITGRTILNRNGVIRNIVNMGLLQLPQKTKAHSSIHVEGHYFLMRFYSGPSVIRDIARHLKLDPRMIRHNVVKLGDEYVSRTMSR